MRVSSGRQADTTKAKLNMNIKFQFSISSPCALWSTQSPILANAFVVSLFFPYFRWPFRHCCGHRCANAMVRCVLYRVSSSSLNLYIKEERFNRLIARECEILEIFPFTRWGKSSDSRSSHVIQVTSLLGISQWRAKFQWNDFNHFAISVFFKQFEWCVRDLNRTKGHLRLINYELRSLIELWVCVLLCADDPVGRRRIPAHFSVAQRAKRNKTFSCLAAVRLAWNGNLLSILFNLMAPPFENGKRATMNQEAFMATARQTQLN